MLFKNAYHGGPLILLLMAYYLMKGLCIYTVTAHLIACDNNNTIVVALLVYVTSLF